MKNRQTQLKNTNAIFRTMREILVEASAAEVDALGLEYGLDTQKLSQVGREVTNSAIEQYKQNCAEKANMPLLHKGLNVLLIMLRRRDNLDEAELSLKANVDEEEIRRIEFDSNYLPSPRTIYNLEKAFSLPSGVLVKLSGAIVHQAPEIEERVMEFAANAKSMGKLSKDEKHLLNAFVKFLTEQK